MFVNEPKRSHKKKVPAPTPVNTNDEIAFGTEEPAAPDVTEAAQAAVEIIDGPAKKRSHKKADRTKGRAALTSCSLYKHSLPKAHKLLARKQKVRNTKVPPPRNIPDMMDALLDEALAKFKTPMPE